MSAMLCTKEAIHSSPTLQLSAMEAAFALFDEDGDGDGFDDDEDELFLSPSPRSLSDEGQDIGVTRAVTDLTM